MPSPAPSALSGYCELHCLSNFTFLRGASHAAELVERAVALGYSALILRSSAAREWMLRQGAESDPGTPEALTALMKAEIDKWGKVIRAAGIKAE